MPERRLKELRGIGKSMLLDFELLGVANVADLARRDGFVLYKELEEKTGKRQDPCVLDTFRCAIAQARNPQLPREQCDWWWWSRERLAGR
ncbi:helix-hairpin-helix domain-containing protein [Bryobacter aggregatus]|uniref:helix-hairpin-helix domain-containing protein n=1 Tax=Bryobacter aggregatus TaxID=360054 RepID=UPI0004E19CDE|nr:helix-hairpin-helix domain-containing protein [Bryobacter aggregatus]